MQMPDTTPISATELREAIAEGRFVLLYQPQVTPDGATIAAVEALVRLRDRAGKLVGPDRFIPLAEKSGQILALGKWVLRRACEDAVKWSNLTVSVNVSPMQFRDAGFVDFVANTVRQSGLPFSRLELEITESAYFDDINAAEVEIRRLRDLGIGIALDDFGTGYASLTYLRRLALTKIKIDRSFVNDVGRIDCAAIIQAVCAMSRAMGLKITAEGVETPEQARFLKAAGCHYMQGYLFSLPVSATEIAAKLAAGPFPARIR
jgi:EAL domain-containing protein (putative c-di-GMP-specific phosphodiesterase class I)